MAKVNIQNLMDAGVHFGHQTQRWNPKMKPYIHGSRNGIHIMDLTQTMRQLEAACRFLYNVVSEGGQVLVVGTKRQAQDAVREAATATNMHYVCERWLGGTLTNHQTIRKSIRRMQEIQGMVEAGELESRSKKEGSSLRRELNRLERNLSGIVNLNKMPDAMVIVDVTHENIAVREAQRLNIPIVALVDTNSNPDPVEVVVPGNDDALRSVKIIVETLAESMKAGIQVHAKRVAEEEAAREAERAAAEAAAAEAAAAEAAARTAEAEAKEAAASEEKEKAADDSKASTKKEAAPAEAETEAEAEAEPVKADA